MKTKIFDPKKEIINTLSYKKIFNQPMTFYQLVYFCHTKFEHISEIENLLRELIERHKIKYLDGYYLLGTSRGKKEDIKELKTKFSQASSMYEKLEGIKFLFNEIPFIKFVGVTGTLASYNFDFEKDDIDLFFICSKNRLWITRFFVVLILKIMNLYVNNHDPKIKICPNLYISEDNLVWKEDKRSLYIAHEIAMMQPIIDKNNTYLKFLSSNSWVNDFLPNFEITSSGENYLNHKELSFLDFVDSLIMNVQKFLMKVRYGSEVLEKNFIHFIKTDHSYSILENYEKIKS